MTSIDVKKIKNDEAGKALAEGFQGIGIFLKCIWGVPGSPRIWVFLVHGTGPPIKKGAGLWRQNR